MLETSKRSWLDLEKHNDVLRNQINNLWNRQWISLLWIDYVSCCNNEHIGLCCGLVYGMTVSFLIHLLPHTCIGIQFAKLVMNIFYCAWSNYGHQRSDLNTFRFRIAKSEGDCERYNSIINNTATWYRSEETKKDTCQNSQNTYPPAEPVTVFLPCHSIYKTCHNLCTCFMICAYVYIIVKWKHTQCMCESSV